MLLSYDVFYRKHGVRNISQFRTPRVMKIDEVILPKESLYHFYTLEDGQMGPFDKDVLFSGTKRKIPIEFMSKLTSEEMVMRAKPFSLKTHAQKYIKDNKKFVYHTNMVEDGYDFGDVGVLSYGAINDIYLYKHLPLADYYRWFNLRKTICENINAYASKNPTKQSFLFLDVPKIIPGISNFKVFSNENKFAMLKKFSRDDDFNILDLWRWLDPETRPMSTLNSIAKENFKSVNLIFKYEDIVYMINLEKLSSFSEVSLDDEDGKTSGILGPFTVQKLFIRSMMYMHEYKEQELSQEFVLEEIPVETSDDELRLDRNTEDEDDVDVSPDETSSDLEIENYGVKKDNNVEGFLDKNDENFIKEVKNDNFLNDLDNDLDDLDELDKYDKVMSIGEEPDDNSLPEDIVTETPIDINAEFEATPEENSAILEHIFSNKTDEEKLDLTIEKYKGAQLLSSAEYKKIKGVLEKFKNSKSPYANENIISYSTIKNEDLVITNEEADLTVNESTVDPRMAQSKTKAFEDRYVKEFINKDKVAFVRSVQKAGILIDSYDVEKVVSALGEYEMHTLKVKPILGPSSIIRFKMPIVNKDGEFVINNKAYYSRKQRADLPIRKINKSTVALTSYFGKTFVDRDSRVANDSITWLNNYITKLAYSDVHSSINRIVPSNMFIKDIKVPFIYSSLSQAFNTIVFDKIELHFDYLKRGENLDPKTLSKIEKDGKVVCGWTIKDKTPIVVDKDNNFFIVGDKEDVLIGDFFAISNIDRNKEPVDFVNLRVFSKEVPICICICHKLGFFETFKYLGVKPRIIESNKRSNLEPYEYELKFKDYKIILDKRDRKATLIFGGFYKFTELNKTITLEQMKNKDVYFDYFKEIGLNSIYIKELDLYYDMFVDPITEGILVDMKEPITFMGLLFRSVELLTSDRHPNSTDMRFMRIKGYEKMNGAIYKELVTSVRELRVKSVIGKSQLNMSPYAVWKDIATDESNVIVSDINPIEYLKQRDAVTFTGMGGRSKDSIMGNDRIFGDNEVGFISETSPDSSDVGINTFLTANPAIKNIRGVLGKFDYEEVGSAGVLSISAAASAGATNDDPKRVNFISVQQSHTVGCDDYHQAQVRTGYESIIPQRTKGIFAVTANKDGKVISLNEKGIIVEYNDGEKVGVTLGRTYGHAEGSVYPHDIVTEMKLGGKVKKGEAIAYNTAFFEPDFFNKKQIVWKSSVSAKTVLYESPYTIEDSSSLSKSLAQSLSNRTTIVRSIVVNFNQNIRKVFATGKKIDMMDILCYIEDEVTSSTDIFNEENIDTLKALANKSPKAKYSGVLDKIEVLYHGAKEDMLPTLRKIADASDKDMMSTQKSKGAEGYTGSVDFNYRVGGNPLLLDTAEIKFYITVDHPSSVGDKGVVGHQIKTVFGGVMNEDMVTENNEKIECVFGARSIAARIVRSVDIIGTTATVLNKIAELAVKTYKG